MRVFHPLSMSAVMAALATFAAADANAQQRPVSSGPRITLPSHTNHFSWERHRSFRGGVFVVEREVPVIIEREVVREVKAAEPVSVAAPVSPRKPYVVGGTYASLPQGCMKMIEEGASYYFCGGGEWYRQLGAGRGSHYRAVARP